jgi:hypothetical protein
MLLACDQEPYNATQVKHFIQLQKEMHPQLKLLWEARDRLGRERFDKIMEDVAIEEDVCPKHAPTNLLIKLGLGISSCSSFTLILPSSCCSI